MATQEQYLLVQGDTGPQLRISLVREDTSLPVDITDATTRFKFRRVGTNIVLTTLTSVSSAEDSANGVALFVWDQGDLDQPPGKYEAEIEISFPQGVGEVETVYETLQFTLREDF
jgi:hypothetical protein